MNRHNGQIKGFYRFSKSWLADTQDKVKINVGMYNPQDGSTTGEFHIIFHDLGQGGLTARVEIFQDVFSLFGEMQELFKRLEEMEGEFPQEDCIYHELILLGYKDLTEYEPPKQIDLSL